MQNSMWLCKAHVPVWRAAITNAPPLMSALQVQDKSAMMRALVLHCHHPP
jgi:hypothetical protein